MYNVQCALNKHAYKVPYAPYAIHSTCNQQLHCHGILLTGATNSVSSGHRLVGTETPSTYDSLREPLRARPLENTRLRQWLWTSGKVTKTKRVYGLDRCAGVQLVLQIWMCTKYNMYGVVQSAFFSGQDLREMLARCAGRTDRPSVGQKERMGEY